MTWKPYNGESFEGLRLFKFTEIESGHFWTDYFLYETLLTLELLKSTTQFYLDESESFTKEDMRECFEAGGNRRGYEPYSHDPNCKYEPSFDEWLNGREGNQ
jgi:hypothetical protein